MDNASKYIEVQYKLYTVEGTERILEEETEQGEPFVFVSGFGSTIPEFEKNIVCLQQGDKFDFTIDKDNAYGDYFDERVIELDRDIFCINGRLDKDNVFVGAFVPLQNADGNRFMGQVLDITDKVVKIDLNHPLAGKSLNFVGEVVTSREATNAEVQNMVNQLAGACGGDCGHCGGGCNGGDCEGGNCGGGCGNCGK